jgi:hypothetical protein
MKNKQSYRLDSKPPNLENIISKIIELRTNENELFINKFSLEWLIHELDEQKLHYLE